MAAARHRIETDGLVKVSIRGRAWTDRGDTGGEPQAITSDAKGVLYVALLDGAFKESRNGGRTWTSFGRAVDAAPP